MLCTGAEGSILRAIYAQYCISYGMAPLGWDGTNEGFDQA